jgi:hypothetical protein
LAGHDLRGRARVFDFNVDCQFPFSQRDAMVFEIALLSSSGMFAVIQRHANKRYVSFVLSWGPQMRLAVFALAIIVMASAIAMAFNYAHRPSYAAPNDAKRNLDANGNPVIRSR